LPKLSLDIEYDYDFVLIGISCHEKDYRISWALNNVLCISLKKEADLEIKEKKQKENSSFPFYTFEYQEKYFEFSLIGNRSSQGMLLPEQKQADFLLKITGNVSHDEKEEILKKIKSINIVLMAYEIDANQLKSKQNLLF
jgi:hypothetical protein